MAHKKTTKLIKGCQSARGNHIGVQGVNSFDTSIQYLRVQAQNPAGMAQKFAFPGVAFHQRDTSRRIALFRNDCNHDAGKTSPTTQINPVIEITGQCVKLSGVLNVPLFNVRNG